MSRDEDGIWYSTSYGHLIRTFQGLQGSLYWIFTLIVVFEVSMWTRQAIYLT